MGEMTWHIRSMLGGTDRIMAGRRLRERKLSSIVHAAVRDRTTGFHLYNGNGSGEGGRTGGGDNGSRYNSLLKRAEKIVAHRLSFFDQKDRFLGDPIRWNRDHKRGKDAPTVLYSALDYRDVDKVGDCKYIWEPNRHHQLVVLARAYHVGGDVRYARSVAEQLESWLDQNPYGRGINWCSGVELGVRLINWVWALDLIAESHAIGDELYQRILNSVSQHIWEINRTYHKGPSANCNLIGEATGVFVASSYFNNLTYASRWRKKSLDVLNREIMAQTFADGGCREQSFGCHLLTTQLCAVAGITGRLSGRDFPAPFWARLEKMFEFIATLSEAGRVTPEFGDCDEGRVLDLGGGPLAVRNWLGVGATLFGRSDFRAAAGDSCEAVEQVLGKSGLEKYQAIPTAAAEESRTMAFGETGYYLLRQGGSDVADQIRSTFDCGPMGQGMLATHAHADALSFTLRAFGRDVLVDPGTYDYYSYPKWREYFRSTRAHNTVAIDGGDQSEMQGSFAWGKKAEAVCLLWKPTDTGGKVIGQHDGYTRLRDPVIHRRMLDLSERELVIRDDIIAKGDHDIEIFFHFAEQCVVKFIGENCYRVDVGQGTVEIELDACLRVDSYRGSEDPICGWVSRGFHRKEPSTTLVGRYTGKGNVCLVCRIEIGV